MAHILVVDDERSICELLEITFRKEGHRVEVAASAEAAKRRLESNLFDIVISDIRLPDQNGVELLAYTREGGRWKCRTRKGKHVCGRCGGP